MEWLASVFLVSDGQLRPPESSINKLLGIQIVSLSLLLLFRDNLVLMLVLGHNLGNLGVKQLEVIISV